MTERYLGVRLEFVSWKQTKTDANKFGVYLEYLRCYDLLRYIDQCMMFQQVVQTVEDLLLTQEEIWRKYYVKGVNKAKAMLRHVKEYLESFLQI
jgi:hypothetical protein